ncbi:glycoside hydrolase family 20 zincin-like fold domain-containing protein, partial [candidate division KSB1 bacterium]|nr:glycoside hydrolase family 20 zincin-like fold domain-containing protein [candidate division KSB1 bacterium]
MNNIIFILRMILSLLLIFITCTTTRVQKMETEIRVNVIPVPAKMQPGEGHFAINSETKIYFNQNDHEIKSIGDYLAEKINLATGFQLTSEFVSNEVGSSNSIVLKIQNTDDKSGAEGYE